MFSFRDVRDVDCSAERVQHAHLLQNILPASCSKNQQLPTLQYKHKQTCVKWSAISQKHWRSKFVIGELSRCATIAVLWCLSIFPFPEAPASRGDYGSPPCGARYMLVHADEVPHRQRACQVPALSQTLSIDSPKTRLPAECCSIQSWSGGTDPQLFKTPYQHSTTPISDIHTHWHQAGRHNSSLSGDLYTMKNTFQIKTNYKFLDSWLLVKIISVTT